MKTLDKIVHISQYNRSICNKKLLHKSLFFSCQMKGDNLSCCDILHAKDSYMKNEQIAELRLGYSSDMFLEISTRGVLAQILIGPLMSL
jgi:hypothetical protein